MDFLTRKRTIMAAHITDVVKVASVKIADKITIDYVGSFALDQPLDFSLNLNGKKDAVQVVLSENKAFSFVRDNLTSQSIETEKRKLGVTEDHVFDFLNMNGRSVFVYSDKEYANNVTNQFTGSDCVITHENVVLIYYFQRFCPYNSDSRTAIIHVGNGYVSLIALHSNVPRIIYTRPCSTNNIDDRLKNILSVIDSVCTGKELGWDFFTEILLFGTDDQAILNRLNEVCNQVEVPDIFKAEAIDSSRIKPAPDNINGNLFTIPVASAIMRHEAIGINLADTKANILKEIPTESNLHSEPSEIGKVIDTFNLILPKVIAQKTVILSAFLVVALLFGIRFYLSNKETERLGSELSTEQARAATLVDIREKHEQYKSRIAEISQRIAAIEQIQADQLLAKTVLDSISDKLPRDVNLSELVVDRANVKLAGYTLDRTQVLQLASQVGTSGQFSDVVPVYADPKGSQTISFTVTCRYVGAIPKPEYKGY